MAPVNYRVVALFFMMGSALLVLTGCSTTSNPASVARSTSSTALAPSQGQAGSSTPSGPKWELAVPDHPSVEAWVRNYSGQKHKSFQTQLERARSYVVPSQQVFEGQGLPKDLIFVALVESGFTPKARSHAKAVGMWQFIPETGKRFGLEQNRWVDERCHPMKAARAAAEYLSFLYDTFGSWPLALAAYNAGEKAVQRNLDQSGLKTFWELADNGYLPAETRDYVPKVLATVKIIRDPVRYGFNFNPGHYVEKHETVPIPGGVKLSWVGKQIGVPEEQLQDCNPELCQPVTPPGCSKYELCVPEGKGGGVLEALLERSLQVEQSKAKAVAAPSNPVSSHKIRPGDSWLSLAGKYNSSAKALAALNGANPSSPLKAGQMLKVPGKALSMEAVATQTQARKNKNEPSGSKPGAKKSSVAAQKPSGSIHYQIRQGETLGSIADKFGVPVKALCAQNELKPTQKLTPGTRLVIAANQRDSEASSKKSSKK